MIRIFIFFITLLPFSVFAQKYIDKKKADIKKELVKYISDNEKIKATLYDTDSSLLLSISETESQPVNFIYLFDKTGKCRLQKTIAYCDSCLNKYLQEALSQKKYKWRKINENQYISSYEEKMMIELAAEGNGFSFMILRTSWSKLLYDMLAEVKQ